MVQNYPRGQKPLIGAFSRFCTGDVIDWFEQKGLQLKIEKDGRIFPKSNSSAQVIECLRENAFSIVLEREASFNPAPKDIAGEMVPSSLIIATFAFFLNIFNNRIIFFSLLIY